MPREILWNGKNLSIVLCVLTHTMCCLCFWEEILMGSHREREISSVYERMTSSVDDHGWQGQVQDNYPEGLHAWSLWMITWWTHEDKYKAKLPTLCMGELLEDFTNVLPFNLIQEETSTSSSSERLESKVLVPSTLVLWSDEHRRNTYTQEWILDSYVV